MPILLYNSGMKRALWLGLIAVAALSFAQGTALVRKPAKGDKLTYALELNMVLFGESATYTSTLTETVVDVDEKGNYSVEKAQSNYKVEVFGEEGTVNDSDLPKPVFTYSPTGELVSIKSDLKTADVYRMAQMEAIHLPNKEVKKDDVWSFEVPEDKERGTFKAKADYKITGEEKIGEEDVWIVSISYAEAEGPAPITANGTVWLSKKDSSVVKLELTWNNAPIPGSQSPISGSTKMERKAS